MCGPGPDAAYRVAAAVSAGERVSLHPRLRGRAEGWSLFASSAGMGYAKKLTNRRKMADFMSTSVIPVMDDLAKQILREKPNSVKGTFDERISMKEDRAQS